MGGIGAILAAAADPRVAAVVATSSPADPYRLTRQTFRLARLPIPDPIAYPLAWLTTRVYLRPRGHDVDEVSASGGDRPLRGAGPAGPRRRGRRSSRSATSRGWPRPHARPGSASRIRAPLETLVVAGGQHSWLYEYPALPPGRRARSWRARSAGRSTRTRPASSRPRRRPSGSPTPRPSSRPSRTSRAGSGRWRQVALPGATRRPAGRRRRRGRPDARTAHRSGAPDDRRRHRSSSRDAPGGSGLGRRSREARHPAVRRPAARRRPPRADPARPAGARAAPRTCSAGRSSSAATEPTSRSWRRSGRGPATSPAPPSAIALVTPGPARPPTRRCRSCSTSARRPQNMMLAAWELGIGSVPATVYDHDLARGCSATRTTTTASTCCRSAIRPTRPTSPGRRRPAAGGPRRDRPRGALVGRRARLYCQLELARRRSRSRRPASRASTATQTHSGANARAADHHLAQRVGEVGQRDQPGDRLQRAPASRRSGRTCPTGTSSGTGRRWSSRWPPPRSWRTRR